MNDEIKEGMTRKGGTNPPPTTPRPPAPTGACAATANDVRQPIIKRMDVVKTAVDELSQLALAWQGCYAEEKKITARLQARVDAMQAVVDAAELHCKNHSVGVAYGLGRAVAAFQKVKP